MPHDAMHESGTLGCSEKLGRESGVLGVGSGRDGMGAWYGTVRHTRGTTTVRTVSVQMSRLLERNGQGQRQGDEHGMSLGSSSETRHVGTQRTCY